MKLKWKKEMPNEAGWYWQINKNDKYEKTPQIIEIRNYAGELAIGNSLIKDWDSLKRFEWAGPIPLPEN